MVLAPDDPTAIGLVDFWRKRVTSATSGTGLLIAANSSTGYLPTDYYYYESFYDNTAKNTLDVIHNPSRRSRSVEALQKKANGPPEAIEILDVTTDGSSNWRRQFTIYPSTLSGVTPSIDLVYYRVPASMPGSSPTTEYPDAPVEFHPLWIHGTVMELLGRLDPNSAAYDRAKMAHDEMIQAIARQAKVVRG